MRRFCTALSALHSALVGFEHGNHGLCHLDPVSRKPIAVRAREKLLNIALLCLQRGISAFRFG
jgi:hypothetical protein